MASSRVFAISDLHVDYKENLQFVQSWSAEAYKNDALILAGDVTDNIQLLETTLRTLKSKFAEVFFVPGNHELWIRPHENVRDSVAKFRKILALCERLGVHTQPAKFFLHGSQFVWLVPLFSWYTTPEEDFEDTLYMTHPAIKDDSKKSDKMWMDNHMTKWPKMTGTTKSKYFAAMNKMAINKVYNAPVITFSHMVPRREMIRPGPEDHSAVNHDRCQKGLGELPKFKGTTDGFNFTRYAGCNILDHQIRKVGATVHVYGHQHRNRDRLIDGVRYISHCLGNVTEQKEGYVYGISHWNGPKQVWPAAPSH